MLSLIKRYAAVVLLAAAGTITTTASAEVRLQGAGATFPNPIYQRWVTEYQKSHPDIKIDYQSIGSGGGIKGISEQTIDFAGSDAPMSKKEIAAAQREVVHIPTVAGAVVPAYNIPGVRDLKLTGELIAQIYMGKVTRWNDPKIQQINQGVNLPNMPITPAWRTDGSGTTFVFTNYLTTQSDDFTQTVGAGKQVKWPIGQGGKGNEGVTAVVQSTPGALGYIEQNYATANAIPFAAVRNQAGNFVKASGESVAAAGEGALSKMDKSLAVDIWNQPGDKAYPIAAFTYIIVYKDLGYLKDPAKARALVHFLTWAITDAAPQRMAEEMGYAPLATGVQNKVKETIARLQWEGKALAAR